MFPFLEPLAVRLEPQIQEEDEGSSVTFRAIVDGGAGGPGPAGQYQYTWTRVGYPGLPSSAVVVGNTLTINDLKIEDYGQYKVTVTGGGGASGTVDGEVKVRRGKRRKIYQFL